MTENKRFVIPHQMRIIRDTVTGKEAIFYDIEDGLLLEEWLNTLYEENEQLKSQLYCDDEEGVCNICKHHFLVSDDESELGYYNSRCKKGHYECARISLKHCKDFELKGLFK